MEFLLKNIVKIGLFSFYLGEKWQTIGWEMSFILITILDGLKNTNTFILEHKI